MIISKQLQMNVQLMIKYKKMIIFIILDYLVLIDLTDNFLNNSSVSLVLYIL